MNRLKLQTDPALVGGRKLIVLAALAMGASTLSQAEDKVAPEPGPPRIAAPGQIQAPVAVQNPGLTISQKPIYPNAQPGQASDQVTERGLALTVQPEQKSFPLQGPLAFLVTLENTTDKTISLYAPEALGGDAKLVIVNQQNSRQWSPGSNLPDSPTTITLAAGKSIQYTVSIGGVAPILQPQPIPLPGGKPVPRAAPVKGAELQKAAAKRQAAAEKPQDKNAQQAVRDRRRPAVGVVLPAVRLPCGSGNCRARLLVEFTAKPNAAAPADPYWTGRIASAPIEFAVEQGVNPPIVVQPPVIINPPIVQPPVVVPGQLTQEQAVNLAAITAERALTAASKSSNNPNQPDHSGAWIANPAKTAKVVADGAGGWKVNWTHFPEGQGWGYNVTIGVSAGRGVSVQEVFTSYSAR